MMHFDYERAPYPIREDLPAGYRAYWQALAAPGTWWTGAERVAIARETRSALACEFCARRRAALSPHGVDGDHLASGDLDALATDTVHRVVTDQSRITQKHVDDIAGSGLSKEAYVELVGVVVAVLSIDEFHRALGMELEPLPEPLPGAPTGYRPPLLSEDMGFVPTIPREGAQGAEADLWSPEGSANVVRALSAVPNALREWREIAAVQYIALQRMGSYAADATRSISRTQMELVAGRVSAVNACFY